MVWSHFNLMSKCAECLCIYFWEWDDWNLSPDAHSIKKYSILIYIQQDAMLYSLFHLETALHVSGGITTHHS